MRHLIDLWRLSGSEIRTILDDAHARKAARAGRRKGAVDADAPAAEATLAMIFEKNSTRTRFSFDAAIRQLGGDAIIVSAGDMQLGRGETIEDTARTLSRMVDLMMIRANRHADVERFAAAATVPVINGLTDLSHPCQILADLMTFEERHGPLVGRSIAWVGDGNNVCASFLHAAPKLGYRMCIATPAGYAPRAEDVARARAAGAEIVLVDDPQGAVTGADCVVTDTWVSMGDADYDARMAAFAPFQVDEALMAKAAPVALFMHCLPAHRGEEVVDAVIDGEQSVVWDEAENRLHAQKAVIAWCLVA